jgi:hypothetical protein
VLRSHKWIDTGKNIGGEKEGEGGKGAGIGEGGVAG